LITEESSSVFPSLASFHGRRNNRVKEEEYYDYHEKI